MATAKLKKKILISFSPIYNKLVKSKIMLNLPLGYSGMIIQLDKIAEGISKLKQ